MADAETNHSRLRFACDTGGTFTDLVVEDTHGGVEMFKAPTTPADPIDGVLASVALAAEARGLELADYLARGDVFIHGTTHAINAILTGNTSRTGFLTTAGHPDVLLLREGSRPRAFDHSLEYPDPYVPRSLTFEIPGRFDAQGEELTPLDEDAVRIAAARLDELAVEAVAVCLLWSIVNASHERRVGELLAELLPGVPVTLSHELNPSWREYRRASSAAIDASLKPLMDRYLGGLTQRLGEAGFSGRVLCLTSQGGMVDAEALAATPIHAVNSGPALAPIAGGHYNGVEEGSTEYAIVADTGGTTYDVSLVRGDTIPWTRETWVGGAYQGHMTGFPSVDVRSIGAGGGSIAWVDSGGVLHVGPQSAGADPGPACYGRGGTHATVTDASLVLGHLDASYFLGGALSLDVDRSHTALQTDVADPLGLELEPAAWAVIDVATESMVQAILAITVNQGIDPARATLIGGGGAAGLNAIYVARRLRCPRLIIPDTGAALSAAGALMSRLTAEHRAVHFTTTASFDPDGTRSRIDELAARCQSFLSDAGVDADESDAEITFGVEARYENQAWEIPVELGGDPSITTDASQLAERFHEAHREVFAIEDRNSIVEFVSWWARASADTRDGQPFGRLRDASAEAIAQTTRRVYLADEGAVDAAVIPWSTLEAGASRTGPAIVESPFTTVVLDTASRFERTASGSLVIHP